LLKMLLSHSMPFTEDKMISVEDIKEAYRRIKKFIHKTPLIYSDSFSRLTGAKVYIKAENLQKTGSFKVRGAFNKLSGMKGKVITVSMGNHAQAVAFAGSKLGIKTKVIMPVTVPIVKAEATKGYGATVELVGENYSQALEYAKTQKDYIFIHGFDDEKIIAGQGTIGLEIMEEIRDIDALLVPVGGGGLISGIAVAVKSTLRNVKVLGVQTKSAISAMLSLERGKIVEFPPRPTIADGIAIGRIGELNFEIMKKYVDDIIAVKEETIAMSILLFLERKKLVVEGAGAVPLAALLENERRFGRKNVVLVVSGGNIDFNLIDRIIYKGLVQSGRIGVIEAVVEDVPGSLQALTEIIAKNKGNILDVQHDRISKDLPIGKTKIIFTIEIRNNEHLRKIYSDFKKEKFSARVLTG